jgi:hypothetical protein
MASQLFAVPMQINYQGYLTDENNMPVNKTVQITFKLYNQDVGGNMLWSEIRENVAVEAGIYAVVLSNITPDLFNGEPYLGVTIDDDVELSPRQKITSVVFAIKSHEAETIVDGAVTQHKIATSAVTTDKIADHAVTTDKIVDGPGSGLNADVLDGIDSDRFSLKDECIQKGQDSMQIKKILPNSTPITSNIHSGSMYAKSSGVDFQSDHTIVKDLVLYWKMDESSGDIIKDYVASSNGVALSAPEIVSGNPGNARRFHGVKGQYIMKAHDAIIDFGRNNFTVSFKIKAGEPQNWTIIMGKANNLGINDTDFGWLFCNKGDVNGTDLEFVINPGDAGNRNNKFVSASNIFDNQWHHIAATRNHEQIKLYVDGQLKDTTDGVIQSVHVESPLIIGAGMGDYVFSGTIDELAMWHRALTANEISELSDDGMYSKGLPIVDSALFFVNGEKRSRLDAWKSKGSDISFEDGKVGIGTNQPQTTLDVNGGVRVGRFTTATRPVCNDTIVGTFIFDTDKKKPFVCDGSLWKPLDSDYDEDGIVDWNDQDDNDPLVKDDQLKSENIKTGVEIFGVDGSYTNDATSLASDVKNGKSFYAGGQKVVGNMTVYETDQQATLVSNSGGRLKFRVPAGYFDGSLDVFGVDGDLVSGNIKEGVEIFGVTKLK